MGRIREWIRRRAVDAHPLPDALWEETLASLPIFRGRGRGDLDRLRWLSTAFLLEKEFFSPPDLDFQERDRLLIALFASLPLLGLSLDWYSDWKSIFVVPDLFRSPWEEEDGSGIMAEGADGLSGQVFDLGPIAFSLKDVRAGGRGTGYNVVIHEMCHKLDGRDGDMQGCPPLHRGMSRSAWRDAFTEAWEGLHRVEAAGGRRKRRGMLRGMDPYATRDPAEFFAVACEYFFERPDFLKGRHPGAYAQLCAFFRQDPSREGMNSAP